MNCMDHAAWACREKGCDAGGTGTQADVDKASARHTERPPKHATATWLVKP